MEKNKVFSNIKRIVLFVLVNLAFNNKKKR